MPTTTTAARRPHTSNSPTRIGGGTNGVDQGGTPRPQGHLQAPRRQRPATTGRKRRGRAAQPRKLERILRHLLDRSTSEEASLRAEVSRLERQLASVRAKGEGCAAWHRVYKRRKWLPLAQFGASCAARLRNRSSKVGTMQIGGRQRLLHTVDIAARTLAAGPGGPAWPELWVRVRCVASATDLKLRLSTGDVDRLLPAGWPRGGPPPNAGGPDDELLRAFETKVARRVFSRLRLQIAGDATHGTIDGSILHFCFSEERVVNNLFLHVLLSTDGRLFASHTDAPEDVLFEVLVANDEHAAAARGLLKAAACRPLVDCAQCSLLIDDVCTQQTVALRPLARRIAFWPAPVPVLESEIDAAIVAGRTKPEAAEQQRLKVAFYRKFGDQPLALFLRVTSIARRRAGGGGEGGAAAYFGKLSVSVDAFARKIGRSFDVQSAAAWRGVATAVVEHIQARRMHLRLVGGVGGSGGDNDCAGLFAERAARTKSVHVALRRSGTATKGGGPPCGSANKGEDTEELGAAASAIQKRFRGYRQRKEYITGRNFAESLTALRGVTHLPEDAEHILVACGGSEEASGVYVLRDDFDMCGAPMFVMCGDGDGSGSGPSFAILRVNTGGAFLWILASWDEAQACPDEIYYVSRSSAMLPPLQHQTSAAGSEHTTAPGTKKKEDESWVLGNKGVAPAPVITALPSALQQVA